MSKGVEERWKNTKEIADYLRISTKTVRLYIKKHDWRCYKIRNKWKIDKNSVDKWLEKRWENGSNSSC